MISNCSVHAYGGTASGGAFKLGEYFARDSYISLTRVRIEDCRATAVAGPSDPLTGGGNNARGGALEVSGGSFNIG